MKLVHFLILGAVLFIGDRMIEYFRDGSERSVVRVSKEQIEILRADFIQKFGTLPSSQQVEAMIGELIDEEVLVREARGLLLDKADETVRLRLLTKMRILGEGGKYNSEEDLYRRAYELGLDEDTVIRRHLVHKMQILLAQSAKSEAVSGVEIERYIKENPSLFQVAPRINFSQVFLRNLSQEKVQSLLKRLAKSEGSLKTLEDLSDPFPLGLQVNAVSEEMLARRYGAIFARNTFTAHPGSWLGPFESPFGFHLVKIEMREKSSNSMTAFRNVAERNIWKEKVAHHVAQSMDRLRNLYPVAVDRDIARNTNAGN